MRRTISRRDEENPPPTTVELTAQWCPKQKKDVKVAAARRSASVNWKKASFSARALGAYSLTVAADAAYGEEAQDQVDVLQGGSGGDESGRGQAVVAETVADAFGMSGNAPVSVNAAAAPFLQVFEVLISYLQNLAS